MSTSQNPDLPLCVVLDSVSNILKFRLEAVAIQMCRFGGYMFVVCLVISKLNTILKPYASSIYPFNFLVKDTILKTCQYIIKVVSWTPRHVSLRPTVAL